MTEFPSLLKPLDLGFTTLPTAPSWARCTPAGDTGPAASSALPGSMPIARAAARRSSSLAAILLTRKGCWSRRGRCSTARARSASTADHAAPCTTRAARSPCRSCTRGDTPSTKLSVAPSTLPSPINPRAPRRMTDADIERTIEDIAVCAALAREAGYDGVEIMASEGYLINEFTARAPTTAGRLGRQPGKPAAIGGRDPGRVNARTGNDFIVIYRVSVDRPRGRRADRRGNPGSGASAAEAAGATILNTGIGWHEARVPTIAQKVPRGAGASRPAGSSLPSAFR